jgi:hypothetical protein
MLIDVCDKQFGCLHNAILTFYYLLDSFSGVIDLNAILSCYDNKLANKRFSMNNFNNEK